MKRFFCLPLCAAVGMTGILVVGGPGVAGTGGSNGPDLRTPVFAVEVSAQKKKSKTKKKPAAPQRQQEAPPSQMKDRPAGYS